MNTKMSPRHGLIMNTEHSSYTVVAWSYVRQWQQSHNFQVTHIETSNIGVQYCTPKPFQCISNTDQFRAANFKLEFPTKSTFTASSTIQKNRDLECSLSTSENLVVT